MNRRTYAIVIACLLLAVFQTGMAAEIVTNGSAKAVIVLSNGTGGSERYAGEELQRVIKLMSGTELKLATLDQVNESEATIIVIGTPKTNALIKANTKLSNKLTNKMFCGQEYAVQTEKNKLYLAGSGEVLPPMVVP